MFNIQDRLENFNLLYNHDPDIDYLKSSRINDIVNRALADLYLSQPINPINFLGNWLLTESKASEIKKKIETEKIIKTKITEKQNIKRQKILEIKHQQISNIEKKIEEKKNFLNKIKICNDFENNLNKFSNEIQHLLKLTGVYFCTYDFNRKEINTEDDESAHLQNTKIIRYIGWCDDHKFLQYKTLELNKGISYDLFKDKEKEKIKPTQENLDEDENIINKEKIQENLHENENTNNYQTFNLNHILVEEVVRNPKIKYFREPRLGSFIVIDISFNSCLSNVSLNSALENIINYNTKLKDYEKRKTEFYIKKEEKEGAENLVKDNSEAINHQVHDDQHNNPLTGRSAENLDTTFPEEVIELQEYLTVEKKFILCLDTLGQDRIFTDEEKSFIFEIASCIKNSWENLEKRLLLKDRDLRLNQLEKEIMFNDPNYVEKYEGDLELYLKDFFLQEEFLELEENSIKKQKLTEINKVRYLLINIKQDEVLIELFKFIGEYEFLEFERLFQYIFYFVGYENVDINEDKTNKIDWKKCKHFWNVELLDKLIDYNPYGSRGRLPSYKILSKLLGYFESLDKGAVKTFNYVLGRILEFLILILNMRKNDILQRMDIINNKIKDRNILLEEKNKRDEKKLLDFEEYKKGLETQENAYENIDENKFSDEWEKNNKEVIVPPEIFMDIDEDFDFTS